MRKLYSILFYLAVPFILLRLLFKSLKFPEYRQRINERFSFGRLSHLKPVDVWIHAVSLGEVVAATPLIDRLLAKKFRVLITTMTPSGSAQVIRRFGSNVLHQYIPYDIPWCLNRFLNKIKPRICITLETELWPNLIYQVSSRKIPLFLANARLSDKAFKSYIKVRFLFKPLLNKFTAILAQSDEDARRYIALGCSPNLVEMIGNIKFDLNIEVNENKDCIAIKEKIGVSRTVLIAASTHEGEEKQLLSILDKLKKSIPNIVLFLVPRHSQRFQAVYDLCLANNYKTGLRSKLDSINDNVDIVIIDSLGELFNFYQVSDYAFVGGSLVPIGGHNVLEPMALKVPVFCGPYMNNSAAICRDLVAAEALVMVENVDELSSKIIEIYNNPEQRQQQTLKGYLFIDANKGVVTKSIKKFEEVLAH